MSTSGDGRVATITLDRPRKLNALSLDMVSKLERQLHAAGESSARVVVLRSTSDRAFCVGADIAEFSSFEPEGMWRRWISEGHRVFNALASLRQPTIAVVDGIAAGGGLELALACDLRIGSTRARMSLPETGIGTVPGWGGSQRLAAVVGVSRAKEIVFTRRQIDAATAHAWGLLNMLVEPDDLDTATGAFVADILGGAPTAVQVSKQMIDAAACGAPAAVVEALASGFTASTADFGEGLNAFLNKTTPGFASAPATRHTD
ncbi:enoyl-CoA hydratase (plasmid) [Mycobacterium sp. djl-10]|nr:enoyl-CoA hydratase [Mycobacterium sp. djl-10]